MTALLVFAAVLLAAVLVSEYASRSVLSTAVVFLGMGFLAGPSGLGWIELTAEDPVVERLVELALFSVLFTDGMRVRLQELRSAWQLPGRALLFGMPLMLVGVAAAARWIAGLPWPEAFLVGAVLAPTDPVFAAALLGREAVPRRLRRLLNVESGLNDGLALPLVLVMLAVAGQEPLEPWRLAREVTLGLALGVVVPWVALWLERRRVLSARAIYEPLLAFSVALLLYALAAVIDANAFLAAFAGGVTVASVNGKAREEFHRFGELLTELLKLGTLMVFGSLITVGYFRELDALDYVFIAVVLLAVRPAALELSLLRSSLDWRERVAASWFGPKGFASVLFGLLLLREGGERMEHLFHLVALVVVASIVAHSSTDVLVARWFRRQEGEETEEVPPHDREDEEPHTGEAELADGEAGPRSGG